MYPINLRSSIETCLKRFALSTETYGPGAWVLQLDGPPQPVYAFIEDDWLCLDTALNAKAGYRSTWTWLQAQSTLEGAAKFSFDARQRRFHLQAEIPLIEDLAPNRSLERTLTGFRSAFSKDGVHATGKTAEPSPGSLEPLAAVCAEVGWTCSPKSGGVLSVEIPARHGPHIVYLAPYDSGVRATTSLLPTGELHGLARYGLSILLLSVARHARWVRPCVEQRKNGETAGFEVWLPGQPEAIELGHALNALSNAIQFCGEEAAAISDESVARQFLLQRGFGTEKTQSPVSNTPNKEEDV